LTEADLPVPERVVMRKRLFLLGRLLNGSVTWRFSPRIVRKPRRPFVLPAASWLGSISVLVASLREVGGVLSSRLRPSRIPAVGVLSEENDCESGNPESPLAKNQVGGDNEHATDGEPSNPEADVDAAPWQADPHPLGPADCAHYESIATVRLGM